MGSHGHPAAGSHRRRYQDVAGDAAGRGRAGAAHRLRQRRQPALRACARAAQGDRDPGGPGRGPCARLPATARRGAPAGGRGRRDRAAAGAGQPRGRRRPAGGSTAPRGRDLRRRARAAVRGGRLDSHGHPRGRAPRASRRTHGSERFAERRRTSGRRRRYPHAAAPHRLRSGPVGRAADGRGRHAAQPRVAARRRRGIRPAQRADDERVAARDAVCRPPADHGVLRRRAGAHPRAPRRPVGGRHRRACRCSAAPCSRSSSKAAPSFCPGTSRRWKCARSHRAISAR